MIYIITPCTRPFNLKAMQESLPKENVTWIVVYDSTVKNKAPIEGAITLNSDRTGHFGNPNRNIALEYVKTVATDRDWLYVFDDDNILHPDWYDTIKDKLDSGTAMISWAQCYKDDRIRIPPVAEPKIATIDTAQYMVRWGEVKDLRFEEIYEADGIYAGEAFKRAGSRQTLIQDALCYYNYFRAHKQGNELWAKICMISMFKNEANNIRKMLDSVAPYIDFWVLQDNGSTDGTPDVVNEWAKETGIPGFMYKVEEGWVNFGWNRDHLLQTTLKSDHGCDWIMKMDCDETLEVDADFDWKNFWADKNIQSFHVTATGPGIIYYRAWIWNSRLPWKFNHDPAHETIMIDDGVTGENFQRVDLPKSFRMVGGVSYGESYTVPTKYITDALKLEEKLIRENSMLTDLYHFWYIGKSYEDCYRGDFFPLGGIHQHEYARRCIFYFKEVVRVKHGGFTPRGIDEMAYYALCGAGNAHRYMQQYKEAIECYKLAEPFCPRRNDHLLYLAEINWELRDFKRMLEYTTRMVSPERTCPFPEYYFLINTNMYTDGGQYPNHLHAVALENSGQSNVFSIANEQKKRIFVVDNFYADPHAVRNFALQQQFENHSDWYKGRRTFDRWLLPNMKQSFEQIMGQKITEWESHGMNGKFQYCVPENPLVYHYDNQKWAGLIYLTPDAPFNTGTALYAHKASRIRHIDEHPNADSCFEGGFYDSTKFEIVDVIGNVFNRLVIFDARSFHAATQYFGKDITDSRLFQIFFFD